MKSTCEYSLDYSNLVARISLNLIVLHGNEEQRMCYGLAGLVWTLTINKIAAAAVATAIYILIGLSPIRF